jgi:hypothetical protein
MSLSRPGQVQVVAPERLPEDGGLLQLVATGVADRVLRTDLDQPGFAHLDLGTAWQERDFRQLLVRLGLALGDVSRDRFGRGLRFFSLGRFDQQVSTEAHRDGAPEESILVLGYEPTAVASRLFLLDFTRAALSRGLSPAEFLERLNPLTADGRAALEPFTVEVSGFDPGHFHIVMINNSSLPWERRERGMLGVLHRAIIPKPDPAASRLVNSLILTPLAEREESRIGPDELREFIDSGRTVLS